MRAGSAIALTARHRAVPVSRRRFELPATRTLVAFEAAARLGSITRAAEELATSHSAVSRHIRALEKSFGVVLFERRGRGVALTTSGEAYFRAVQTGLDALRDGGRVLRNDRTGLAIGGTIEITALLLHPVFPKLQSALGDEVAVRIVVYDYDVLPHLISLGLDIVFEAKNGPHPDPQAVPVLDEALVPVASRAFAKRFATQLAGHPRTWRGVPRLDIGRPAPGWATWDTWFAAHGYAAPPAPVQTYENYFNLLSAAVTGDGLAIGWNGFMSEHFGRLVAVRDEWLKTDLKMYAVATADGRAKSVVPACLNELAQLIGGLCRRSPVTARPEPSPSDLEPPLPASP